MNICKTLALVVTLTNLPQISAALDSSAEKLSSDFEKSKTLFERLETLEGQGYNRFISKELPPLSSEVPGITHKIQVALIQGAIVQDLVTRQLYSIKKRVFVWGLVNENDPYTFIVMDKEGNPLYQTHSRYVIPIKDDISIGATPLRYKPVVQTVGPYTHEKWLKIDNYLSLGYENISYPIASQYNGNEESTTAATRGELRSYFPFKIPVKPGITLSFQRGLGQGETSAHSWMAVEMGPAFRYRAYQGKSHSIDLSIFAGRSIYYQAEFDDNSVTLQSSYAGLAVEDVIDTRYGGVTVGAEFRIIDVKNTGSTTGMDIQERNKRGASMAVFIGKELKLSL